VLGSGGTLSELKTFTGRLIESVIAKLKAQYSQSATGATAARATASAPCGRVPAAAAAPPPPPLDLRQHDVEPLCRDLLREAMTAGKSTAAGANGGFFSSGGNDSSSSSGDSDATVVERRDDDGDDDYDDRSVDDLLHSFSLFFLLPASPSGAGMSALPGGR